MPSLRDSETILLDYVYHNVVPTGLIEIMVEKMIKCFSGARTIIQRGKYMLAPECMSCVRSDIELNYPV